MNRTLTEQKVLKTLDIPDFRHLSKDKIITFASLLPRMDPEVAKKALEQFPSFVSTSLELMQEYKGLLEDVVQDNEESTKTCYDTYERIMSYLEKALDRDEISFEERVYILEQMKEIANKIDKKDTENKKFILKTVAIAGTVTLGIIVVLGSTLGSNIGVKSIDYDTDDQA